LESKPLDLRPFAPPKCGVDTGTITYNKQLDAYYLEGPEISYKAERDPEQVFVVDLKGHLFEDKKLGMEMSEDTVPGKVEAESNNRSGEFFGQVIKSGASVFASALGGGLLGQFKSLNVEKQGNKAVSANDCSAFPTPITDEHKGVAVFLTGADYEFFCRLSTPARISYIGMPLLRRIGFRLYANQSIPAIPVNDSKVLHFIAANELVEQISKSANAITAALTSEGDKDPTAEGLALRLKSLNEVLERDAAEFFGRSRSILYWPGAFEVRANSGSPVKIDVFGLDEVAGLCAIANTAEVISVSEGPKTASPTCSGLTPQISLAVNDLPAMRPPASLVTTSTSSGFFYRVPGLGIATLKEGDRILIDKRLAIAQFGIVTSLPTSTGGRKSNYTFELFTATGGLKTFKLASEAVLDKSLISDSEASSKTIIDALATDKKAQAANAPKPVDELLALERRRKILEEQAKIQELQRILATDPAKP